MNWQQLSVQIPAQQSEHLSDLLESLGALAVTLQAASSEEIFEPHLNTTPLWAHTQVVALFEQTHDLQPIIQQLQKEFKLADYQLELIPEEDWQQKYRQSVQPICIANKLLICPSWHILSEPSTPHVILDPGLAFGTGTHPTTALCLEWLTQHIQTQDRVIDYGCGSGILAIAALKLGAKEAWAVDNDPQALEATAENAKRNQCSLTHLHPIFPEDLPPLLADALVANILANPLIAMATLFAQLLKPGGKLALSGIMMHQADQVMHAYQDWFSFSAPIIREEWVRLDGIRKS